VNALPDSPATEIACQAGEAPPTSCHALAVPSGCGWETTTFTLHGFPAYFFVTLLLKLPLGLLAAAACALALALRHRHEARGRDVLLLFALAAAVLLSVMNAGVNAGHRHVIVVEALFALAAGGGVSLALSEAGAARRAWIALLSVAVAAGAFTSVRAHPDALGYTNALAGRDPDWWFVDSNLDWGQDLGRLTSLFIPDKRSRQTPRPRAHRARRRDRRRRARRPADASVGPKSVARRLTPGIEENSWKQRDGSPGVPGEAATCTSNRERSSARMSKVCIRVSAAGCNGALRKSTPARRIGPSSHGSEAGCYVDPAR